MMISKMSDALDVYNVGKAVTKVNLYKISLHFMFAVLFLFMTWRKLNI